MIISTFIFSFISSLQLEIGAGCQLYLFIYYKFSHMKSLRKIAKYTHFHYIIVVFYDKNLHMHTVSTN